MAIVFSMEICNLLKDKGLDACIIDELNKLVTPYLGENRIIEFHPISHTFIDANGVIDGQLCLAPKYVSIASSMDDRREDDINDDEMFQLTLHMYNILKHISAFDLALAGWELGFLHDYLTYDDQLNIVKLDAVEGLVVSKALVKNISLSRSFVEFSNTHVWVPVRSMPGNMFDDNDD